MTPTKTRLWFPVLGDVIKLTEDWTCSVKAEYRNVKFLSVYSGTNVQPRRGWEELPIHEVTVPKDTLLVFDRIYVRAGAESFNSVTFRVQACPGNPTLQRKRFWVNTDEINTKTLMIQRVDSTQDQQGKKEKAAKRAEQKKRCQNWKREFMYMLKSLPEVALVPRRKQAIMELKIQGGLRLKPNTSGVVEVKFHPAYCSDWEGKATLKVEVSTDSSRMPSALKVVEVQDNTKKKEERRKKWSDLI